MKIVFVFIRENSTRLVQLQQLSCKVVVRINNVCNKESMNQTGDMERKRFLVD